jgi:hypothetical protein
LRGEITLVRVEITLVRFETPIVRVVIADLFFISLEGGWGDYPHYQPHLPLDLKDKILHKIFIG